MEKQHKGRIACFASPDALGAKGLAAFIAQRTGHSLYLHGGGRGLAFVEDPLGPRTRLAILSMGELSPDFVRQVICSSPCPVLAVADQAEALWAAPNRGREPVGRTIVCGFDGSPPADVAKRYAAHLASACGARLSAIHVPAAAGPVAGRLAQIADEEEALMIAVGSDCIDPEDLAATRSRTGALLATASKPVLIVQPWTKLPPSVARDGPGSSTIKGARLNLADAPSRALSRAS